MFDHFLYFYDLPFVNIVAADNNFDTSTKTVGCSQHDVWANERTTAKVSFVVLHGDRVRESILLRIIAADDSALL